MENVKVFFCGLSKNSDEILIKNLEFLENYIIQGKFDSNLIIVDSDSNNEIKSKFHFNRPQLHVRHYLLLQLVHLA